MPEITKLSLVSGVPVSDAKKAMMKSFETNVIEMRKWLEEAGEGGFALIGYHIDAKDTEPQVHSWVNYFCQHPADAFWLPDMVKTRVYQRAHE